MTDAKHAPGPWSFDPGFSGKSAFVVDVEGHMIAMLPHADPRGLDNAKLIAAAPQMLAALKAIDETCPTDADVNDSFYDAWQLLKAAIEKAERNA